MSRRGVKAILGKATKVRYNRMTYTFDMIDELMDALGDDYYYVVEDWNASVKYVVYKKQDGNWRATRTAQRLSQ